MEHDTRKSLSAPNQYLSLSGNHSDQTVLCLFKTPNTLLVLGHPWLSNIIPRLTDWSMTSIWSSFFLSVSSELSHRLLTLVLTLILLNRPSSHQSLSSQWTMFYTFMGSPWASSLTKNRSLHLECGRCSAQVLVPSWASPRVSTPRLTAKRKQQTRNWKQPSCVSLPQTSPCGAHYLSG